MVNSFGVSGAAAVEARRGDFGTLADGRKVESVELANARGMSVRILALGGVIQQLLVPVEEKRGVVGRRPAWSTHQSKKYVARAG